MRFSAVIAFGLAAFVMATPVPEAEAEAGLSLPNKIVTGTAPVGLVTRANNTANAGNGAAAAGKNSFEP